MDPLQKRDALFRILLSTTLFLSCDSSTLKLTNNGETANFVPRNIRHYIFVGHPTDVYLTWDPPFNYILPKSSDLSKNTASAKTDHVTTLNRLSVPLHGHSGSKSDSHPQYNVADSNVHESGNDTYAQMLNMNSTKNQTLKTEQKDSRIFDAYGFVDNYDIFYQQKLDSSDMKLLHVNATQTWVLLKNITADKTYQVFIQVSYSNKKQVNSTIYAFSLASNDTDSTSVCKCNSIGTNSGNETCFSLTSIPCACHSSYDGLFCEQCKPQHFMYNGKCVRCPCNSKFGSFNCRLVNNAPVCNCPPAYAGRSCDRCANGYFLYYGMCAKCICNNNIDPNSPDICDPIIGSCRHCLYNTTGFTCDRCRSGFVGDPILHKNCTKQENISKPKILSRHSKTSFPLSLKIGLPLVVLFICIVVGILFHHRHRFYRKLQPFWTIELKDDHDSVNLSQEFGGASSSSHTASSRNNLNFYAKHQGGMQYSPLRETM